jgi:hypothetical protein
MSSLHNLKKISLMISSGFFSPSGSDFCHWFDKKEFKSFYKLVCKEWNVHVVPKNEILGAMVFFYGADKRVNMRV